MIKNTKLTKVLFQRGISFMILSFVFLLVLSNNKIFSQDYAAQVISVNYGSSEWCMGESRNVSITVKNTGTRTWYAAGTTTPCTNLNLKVAVSFKWNGDSDFNTYTSAPFSSRNPIPNNVAPGATVTVKFPVRTPLGDPIGTNNLSINLMAQECQWFSPVVYTSPNLNIKGSLKPGIISNKQALCHGQTAEMLSGSLPTGGNGTYTYQWQTQTNCTGAWTDAAGLSTSADYQPGVLTESTCYRRKVVSDCGTAYSKPVTLTSDLRLYYSFDKQLEPTNNLTASSFDVTFESQVLGATSGFTNQLGIGNVLGVSNTLAYQGVQSILLNRGTTLGVDLGNVFQTTPVSIGEFTSFSTWSYSTLAGPFIQLEYSGGSYSGTIANSNIHSGTGWEYLTVSFPTAAVSATSCNYYLYAPNYNSDTYWDNIQLEKKNHSTPFYVYAGTINTATVLDLSGNGYHGTIKNTSAPTWVENGCDGAAYEFDGGDFISLPNPGLSNLDQEWTVSAFVKVSDLTQYNQFLVEGMNRGNFVYYTNKKQPLLYLNGAANDYYTYGSSSIVANTWHQIVFVFRNSDGLRKIYLDGVNISTFGPNFTSNPIGLLSTFKLGTNLKGGIDELRIYGKAFTDQEVKDFYEAKSLKIKLPVKSNLLATNAQTATCEVKGSDWIHFHEPVTGNLIGSVNANGGDLGSVTLKAGVNSGGAMYACNTASAPQFYTAYMGRNWHVNSSTYASSAAISPNPSIRLPYADGELSAMNAIASGTTTGNPLDNGATAAQVMLTKISGGSVDGNPTNDCSATILGIPQSSFGTITSSYTDLTISGSYADFTVGQFSEIFLNKNFNNSPLPVKLTNFSANCDNEVALTWTTASEQNSNRFIVEKSRDGQTWSFVATQTAAGTSNTIHNYTQSDENSWNGVTYYRLRQIDFNGAEEVYGPISVSCEGNQSSMTVYPNPNSGSFTIEIASTEMYSNAQLFLTDLIGKIITSQKVNVSNGTTQILINDLDLKMGTYLVTLRGADQQLKPVKVMVTK